MQELTQRAAEIFRQLQFRCQEISNRCLDLNSPPQKFPFPKNVTSRATQTLQEGNEEHHHSTLSNAKEFDAFPVDEVTVESAQAPSTQSDTVLRYVL